MCLFVIATGRVSLHQKIGVSLCGSVCPCRIPQTPLTPGSTSLCCYPAPSLWGHDLAVISSPSSHHHPPSSEQSPRRHRYDPRRHPSVTPASPEPPLHCSAAGPPPERSSMPRAVIDADRARCRGPPTGPPRGRAMAARRPADDGDKQRMNVRCSAAVRSLLHWLSTGRQADQEVS